MFATQVLPESLSEDFVEGSNNEIIGYIILDDKKYDLKRGETKIGRDSSLCSVVIENFTISKVHAVIESEGIDDTFIYDIGSTNQTKLGKKILKPHCRYKLDNESKLTFGNVTAKFVVPSDKNSDCNSETSKSGSFDPLNELGDIFDIPTQVNVPQQSTSSKVSDFEKLPANFKVFKIPHAVPHAQPSVSSKNCFDEDTQCRLDSQQTKQRTVYYAGLLENSEIFSLGTQCQLYEPPAKEESKCAVETVSDSGIPKNSETDKIKSLLNDGHDEVLSSFMSLHSPEEQGVLVKEVNTRTELKGLSQVLDAPTQAQVEQIEESIEDRERKELGEILQNKDLMEDFATPCKPSVTSTPMNNKFKHPNSVFQKSNTSIVDEDLIQTQEFNHLESRKEPEQRQDNLSQDAETEPYLHDTLDEQNEDLILTQTFEALEKNHKKTSIVVPETEEMIDGREDFLETQVFANEREIQTGRKALHETPDFNASFTQRNDDDDFIGTQVFDEHNIRKDVENSDRNDNDAEDFIATQKVEFPVNSGRKEADRSSRESSPDLLASGTSSKSSEDCISTQKFELLASQKFIPTTIEPISSQKNENDCNIAQAPELAESSGDETESDLEIILDETTKKDGECNKFIKSEQPESEPRLAENDDSDSSYIFELPPENNTERGNQPPQLSDSDATDCEEIIVIHKVKQEPKEKMQFEETLPNNVEERTSVPNDDWMMNGPESPLSLELPCTQDIETTMNRILRDEATKKTEVGITNGGNMVEPSGNLVDSPLKRPRDSNSSEAVPVKKCKTEDRSLKNCEKQFSKLVQAHDIAQIQPSRTRNSLRSLTTERGGSISGNNINERPTSRRKTNAKKGSTKNSNGDITAYLIKKEDRLSLAGRQKSETSSNENQPGSTRVLRSSTRNIVPTNAPTRKSKRISKSNEYFSSACVNVVFTGFDCEILGRIISDLGGKKTNDLSSGEVVVTDKVRRTVKFLSAVGLGLPIASPQWLLSCKKERKFLNPWDFILKDEESEEKWSFELKASLEKSKKVKLLQGFSIFATKSTKPPVKDLLAIVEFCGGTPLFDFPEVWPKKTIIVSCLEDKKWWPLAKFRHVKIVHYEFILTGVLRQKIDFKTYKLR